MAASRALCASTFRPELDRSIAQDGAVVVLWADSEEILLLRRLGAGWEVARHPAIECTAGSGYGGVFWRGVTYAESGERIATFAASNTDAEWNEFYRDWQAQQRQRYRSGLNPRVGGESLQV